MSAPLAPPARAARQWALWPLMALAPLPLPWTRAAGFPALAAYELAVAGVALRARSSRPVAFSNAALNVAGLLYAAWFLFEVRVAHAGLTSVATNLLLFTAVAKFASLRTAGEGRTALILGFFLGLDAAATSTHVSSLVYLALLGFVGFRALARLSLLAEFGGETPPPSVRRVPTRGLSVLAVSATAAAAAPLFVLLPRLRSPFVHPPVPAEAMGQFASADRVDLSDFAQFKENRRIFLRVSGWSGAPGGDLRLRQAAFDHYRDGRWSRIAIAARPAVPSADGWIPLGSGRPPGDASLEVDLVPIAPGFLFLPYGTDAVRSDKGDLLGGSDGSLQLVSGQRSVRYDVRAGVAAPRRDSVVVAERDVPPAVASLARRLTAAASSREEAASRLTAYLAKGFRYTLHPPSTQGDPVADFLLRTHAGHCEYFASALALMMRAVGIPARLVTGSLGGDVDPITGDVLVRGENLHAWVEADVDGSGFRPFDPTPAAGLPGLVRISLWKRLSEFGEDVSFFYDRNILGFDAFDQAGIAESLRGTLASAGAWSAGALARARRMAREARPSAALLFLALAAAAAAAAAMRRRRGDPGRRAYLALRRLHLRRLGPLSDSAAPAQVVRSFSRAGARASAAAREVVLAYRREAFAGERLSREEARRLSGALRALRRALSAGAAVLLVLGGIAARAASAAPSGPTGVADGYADLRRLQQRVADSRKKLAQVEQQTASLQQEVAALDLRLEVARRQRELDAARRDDLARRSAALAGELAQARSARDGAAGALAARLQLLYRLGRFGYLRPVLAARRPPEVFEALRSLDAMARADSAALSAFRSQTRRLDGDLAAQESLSREAAAVAADDQAQVRNIAGLRSERARLLARSQREASTTRQEVAELSAKTQKLEDLLDILSRGESSLTGSPRPWKGVLDWPVRGQISVGFGRHRHPKFDTWTVSNGIEILAPDGTPVHAVFTGKVLFSRWFSDYGNMVVLDNGDGVLTLYAGLRSISVRVGDFLDPGDVVGLVGTGPGEEAPSLYFEVRDHQKPADPLDWLR